MKISFENSSLAKNVYYQKYKPFFVSFALILTSILLIGLVIIPTIYSYLQNRSAVEKINKEKSLYEKKLSDLKSLDEQSYQNDLAVIMKALPDNQDIPESLTYLLSAISNNRLRIDNLFVSNSDGEGTGDSFTLKIDVTGDINQVKALINDIRNQPRLMKITGLSFTTSERGEFTTSLTVEVYYKKLPETIPNSLSPLPTISATDEKLLSEIRSAFQNTAIDVATGSSQLGKNNPFEE